MKQLIPVSWQSLSAVACSSERVTRLKLPSGVSRSQLRADKVLSEIVQPELEAELERVHARVRTDFGYKRRDLSVEHEELGRVRLVTPDFEYRISVELDAEDLSQAVWRREVLVSGDSAFVNDGRLASVFGEELDSVEYRFAQPLPIDDVVDKIEEREEGGVSVDYDSRCTWCEVSIDGLPATVRLQDRHLVVRPRAGSPITLREILDVL